MLFLRGEGVRSSTNKDHMEHGGTLPVPEQDSMRDTKDIPLMCFITAAVILAVTMILYITIVLS